MSKPDNISDSNNNPGKDKNLDKSSYSPKESDKEYEKSTSRQNNTTNNVIPAIEERFSLEKKIIVEDLKIDKKWISTIKKIEVPVSYEEIYVNDREIRSYKKDDNILSKVKDRIKDSFDDSADEDENHPKHTMQYLVSEKEEEKENNYPRGGALIPLFDTNDNNKETEKVIPLFTEEIVISKRIVKVGEVVIKKWKVIEGKKIDIDIKKEKISIEYPEGTKQCITTS